MILTRPLHALYVFVLNDRTVLIKNDIAVHLYYYYKQNIYAINI